MRAPHQQQEARLRQQHARDGDALPLAAAELRAALADVRVVAARQRAHERVRVRRLGRLHHRRLF
jgi:hypothetical protein